MSESFDHLVSTLSDRYRIERELGSGGMATVYLAHDVRHDRKVALKVLKPDLAAVIGASRFLAEIRTTANLQNPHILPLHDAGEWWDIVWNSGFRGPVSQLTPGQLAQFRQEHLAEVARLATTRGIWLDVPSIFAIGHKA